jgi:hypothetical protein
MLLPGETSTARLIAAAALVHPVISAFWAVVLWRLLPRRATLEWALLADHLMWGASFAIALDRRRRL